MKKKIRAGLAGANGYVGTELLSLLSMHPNVEISEISGASSAGRKIGNKIVKNEIDPAQCDAIFACLPHGEAGKIVPNWLKAGKVVFDLSADFRLKNHKNYDDWYHAKHPAPGLLKKAVYGMPETNSEKIKRADLIACPGCYTTATILGMLPAVKKGLVKSNIFVSAVSGTSGAGKKTDLSYLFCEVNENLSAYSPLVHRHTPEMEQELSIAGGKKVSVSFVPHLGPFNRGIYATITADLTDKKITQDAVNKAYLKEFSHDEFTVVRDEIPHLKDVRGTNYCHIYPLVDARGGRLVVISVVDNLVKGAAGQAVECFNLRFGLNKRAGLNLKLGWI
ncbi:MAG: N-acetyl-gamma-glutamyl-phosphate reductase [Nitrospinae bacterium]|nr:N-acetyl-gamma-glutamyl-phosphate reductase [Nitrospinota bacterium]